MTVYVDSAKNRYGKYVMAHMMADTTDELLDMAEAIGLKPYWIQKEWTASEHFDVAQTKRAEAISRGAKVISSREMVRMIQAKRKVQTDG